MNNYVLFLITLFCWSPTWYLIKFQLGYVDPLVSVFYRFLIAAIIFFIYLLIKKQNLKFLLIITFGFYFLEFVFIQLTMFSFTYLTHI